MAMIASCIWMRELEALSPKGQGLWAECSDGHTFLPEFHPYIGWLKFGFSRSPTVEEKETLSEVGPEN